MYDQKLKVTLGEFEGSLGYMRLYLNQLVNEYGFLKDTGHPILNHSCLCSDGDKAARHRSSISHGR